MTINPVEDTKMTARMRRDRAQCELLELMKSTKTCRTFTFDAFELLGDLTYSIQYVRHPLSKTGVIMRIYFKPFLGLEPLDIEVHEAWIVWQLQPH